MRKGRGSIPIKKGEVPFKIGDKLCPDCHGGILIPIDQVKNRRSRVMPKEADYWYCDRCEMTFPKEVANPASVDRKVD